MKTRNIVVLAIVALLGVYFAVSFSQSLSQYTTIEEARTTKKDVHIIGTWVKRDQTVKEDNKFEFYLQDSTHQTVLVYYPDPMPANFDQADKVLVEGHFQDEVFMADKIQVKCPSKFEAKELE